jgi:hypothetical protein
MGPRGKFTATPHCRSQPCRAKTDPIKDLIWIKGVFNLDVGKGAVGIMAADSVPFRQSINAIKDN